MEPDSIRLLRECDAGVKMGVDSIEDTIDHAQDPELRDLLHRSRAHHLKLGREIEELLNEAHDDGKDPNPMARGMSKLKTSMRLTFEPSDTAVANLITEGCDMGVRSLARYLNQYEGAEDTPRNIARRLIDAEEELREGLRPFL